MRNRIRGFVFLGILCATLFIAAGRLDWPMAWAFVAFMLVYSVAGYLWLPEDLIEERSHLPGDTRLEDLALAGPAFLFLYPVTFIICGLDLRHAWSPPIAASVQGLAFVVFAVGYVFSLWAAHTNRFFSAVVRVQRERGHAVVDRGPYSVIRHPGYAGPIVSHLCLPPALGSLWGLLPALLGIVLLILRTLYEERTLSAELPGYREYMQRVRWRLLPGVW